MSKKTKELIDEHKRIIDIYLTDGKINGTNAVLQSRPHLNYITAKTTFNAIINDPKSKEYINKRRQELRASESIQYEDIIDHLANVIKANPGKYVMLTKEQWEAMPNEVASLCQDLDYREKTYTDRQGNEIKETICKVKMQDKQSAIDKLCKLKGLYSLDNSQKASTINIETLNIQELKLLANILTKTS